MRQIRHGHRIPCNDYNQDLLKVLNLGLPDLSTVARVDHLNPVPEAAVKKEDPVDDVSQGLHLGLVSEIMFFGGSDMSVAMVLPVTYTMAHVMAQSFMKLFWKLGPPSCFQALKISSARGSRRD